MSVRKTFVKELELQNAKRAWFVEWRGFRVDLCNTICKAQLGMDSQNVKLNEISNLKASIATEMTSMDMVSTPAIITDMMAKAKVLIELMNLLVGTKEAAVGKDLDDGENLLSEFVKKQLTLTPDIESYTQWLGSACVSTHVLY